MRKILSVILCVLILAAMLPVRPVTVKASSLVPAFPGVVGGGMYTTGGRGGNVYEVTNLNDSGPGSLREGVRLNDTTIVFRVSGTIMLQSRLNISGSNLTIAGQTAPGEGICIANDETTITGNNIIMRFLRFRVGTKLDQEPDGLNNDKNRTMRNIVIDHCSVSWGVDEVLSVYNLKDSTIQYTITSESLTMSGHAKGRHGYGGIFGGENVTYYGNLIAHHTSRAPRFTSENANYEYKTDFRNNVTYNWGFNNAYGAEGDTKTNIVGNYYKWGPGTQLGVRNRIVEPSIGSDGRGGSYYVEGNFVYGSEAATSDNWGVGVQPGVGIPKSRFTRLLEPVFIPNTPVAMTAEEAYNVVLRQVGAVLPKRDQVDARLVNDVRNGTGRFINRSEEAGSWPELKSLPAPVDTDKDGMPDAWEIAKGLNPNDPSDGKMIAQNGYTNLENYLNHLVEEGLRNLHKNPDITLNSPVENALYQTGSDIEIQVNATNTNGGTIQKVEFYYNNNKLGEVTSAPYSFIWRNVPQGSWYVAAVAVDDAGYRTQSNINMIHVNDPENLDIWETRDIGSVGIKGSANYNNGTFTVKGAGKIEAKADSFQYTYKKLEGNGEMVVRVDHITTVDNGATGGIMIRQDLSADSPFALLSLSYEKADFTKGETGRALQFKTRTSKGVNMSKDFESIFARVPYWLKLTKEGNVITGYYSLDGTTWTKAGEKTINMGSSVYIGFAVDAAKDTSDLTYYNMVKYSNAKLTRSGEEAAINMVSAPSNTVIEGSFKLSGSVNRAARLSISLNGNVAVNKVVSANESFNADLEFREGMNTVEIRAIDTAEFEKVITYNVRYVKDWSTGTFTIDKVALTNFRGNTVTGLRPSGDVIVSFEVKNNASDEKNGIIIAALFDPQGRIVNQSYSIENMPAGSTEVYSAGIRLPSNLSGYKLKVFVWDSMTDQNLVSNEIVFE